MIEREEINRVKYYYHKLPLIGNVFTACLLFDENNRILSRGVAICSLRDSFSKKNGRKISYKRAMKAYWDMETSEEIDETHLIGEYTYRKFKSSEDIENIKEKIDAIWKSYLLIDFNGNVVQIPLWINLTESRKLFKFKSDYLPIPTEDERRIFRLNY